MRTALSARVAAFTTFLREQHGFGVGQAEAHDALRAAESVGITDLRRVRTALRLVYCATPDEAARFGALFDAFFRGPQGIAQPKRLSHRTRPRENASGESQGERSDRRSTRAAGEPANAWELMHARYSASAGRSDPPTIPTDGLDAMLAAAGRLLAVPIAPSRRWRPDLQGARLDLRRTLRASVQTGGEPIALRRRARAPRSARFVMLIDGSRSMRERAEPVLQFAHALCRRTRRAHAFVFSTALCDVTTALSERDRAGRPLTDLGDAWGGGTRIGASLLDFIERYGTRLLSSHTVVFIASDGLDVGEIDRLERAMRTLHARSASLIWLHPHAGSPGFTPAARGIRAALPYLDALAPAAGARDLDALARRLSRHTPSSISR